MTKTMPTNVIAVFLIVLVVGLPSPDCRAELELTDFSVSKGTAGYSEGERPGKLPMPRAGVKEKSAKALAKWNRLKRGMFPKELAEMRFRQRAAADGVFDPRAYLQAKKAMLDLEKRIKGFRKTPDPEWISLGPAFVGGRITDLLFHPKDPAVMWAASPGGGIWKTTDGGKSWSISRDLLSVLTVDALALSYESPSKIFAGSGDVPNFSSRQLGAGILLSEDEGETWAPIRTRAGGPALVSVPIFRIVTNPARPGLILVGDLLGVLRSTDDGKTWERTLTLEAKDMVTDIVIDPTHPEVIFVSCGGLYRLPGTVMVSHSGGAKGSWKEIRFPDLTRRPGRIALGIGASDGTVYASIGNPAVVGNEETGGALALYRSRDRGASWEKMYQRAPGELDYLAYYDENDKPRYTGGQQWYAHAIGVDPNNSDFIILGGVDLYRSEDGGKSIEKVSRWNDDSDRRNLSYVHADIHKIKFSPYDPNVVYACTDGALFVSRDSGRTWERSKASLPITQIYNFALHPERESIIAGAQDNGTFIRRSGDDRDWWEAAGGDGAFCAWDQQAPSLKYGSLPRLGIWRRQWHLFTFVTNGIDKNESRLFIAPFLVDPKDGNHALAGTTCLYRNTAFRTFENRLPAPWQAISGNLAAGGSSEDAISWIALDPSDSRICWVGSSNGVLHVCRNMDAPEPKFEMVGVGQLPRPAWISCIAVSHGDPNCVFVTYTTQKIKQVWRTTDGGKSWKAVTADLPTNVPVSSVIFDPRDPKRLYLGTDMGVFTSDDLGEHWEPMDRGLQFAPVTHLIMKGDTLYASTFGRGMYETRVGEHPTAKSLEKTPVRLRVKADDHSMIAVAKLVDAKVTASSAFRTVTSFNDLADVTVSFGETNHQDEILVMNNRSEVDGTFKLDSSLSPQALAERIWGSIRTVGLLSRIRVLAKRDPSSLEVKYSPDKTGLPEFALGEPFEIRVRPPSDAYLYAFKMSASGALQLLFPTAEAQPRLVRRDESFRLTLEATGKPGSEKMLLVASGRPLHVSAQKGLEGMSALESLAGDLGILPVKKGASDASVDYLARLVVLDTVDPTAFYGKGGSQTPNAVLWKMLKDKSGRGAR